MKFGKLVQFCQFLVKGKTERIDGRFKQKNLASEKLLSLG